MSRLIHINSMIDRQATDLYSTTWTSYLSKPIVSSGKLSMKVNSIDLVNLFYTFGTESSILWVITDVGGTDTLNSFQITTSDNFDSGTTLAAYLTTLCTSISLSFAYDTSTCRLTATNGSATISRIVGSYRYSDLLTTTYNNVIDKLGYTQDLTSTTISAGGTLEGESPLRLLRSTCYYLQCNGLSNINQSITPTPYNNPHILARVSASNFGYVSQLSYNEEVFLEISEKQINLLKFSLLDDELQPVYAQNAPIVFTLQVRFS